MRSTAVRYYFFLLLAAVLSCSSIKSTEQMDSKILETFRGVSIADYLIEFDSYSKRRPGLVSSSIQLRLGQGPHLLVGCMIHGDESGCLPALLDIFKKIEAREIKFHGTLTGFIGNPKAAKQGKRYLDQDLNRVFLSEAPVSYEKDRAHEIMPLIQSADLFLDLHQTIEPTEKAFYTFAFGELQYQWARFLEGANFLMTRPGNVAFATGSRTANEYGTSFNVPSVTFESSQKGMTEIAYDRNFKIILRAIEGLIHLKDSRDVKALRSLARNAKELRLLKRVANFRFVDSKMRLNAGFFNFSQVQKGEVIGSQGDDLPLLAPESGFLVFPKYPRRNEKGEAAPPLPSDLFLIQQEAKLAEFLK